MLGLCLLIAAAIILIAVIVVKIIEMVKPGGNPRHRG